MADNVALGSMLRKISVWRAISLLRSSRLNSLLKLPLSAPKTFLSTWVWRC